jgi:hypothetical protein
LTDKTELLFINHQFGLTTTFTIAPSTLGEPDKFLNRAWGMVNLGLISHHPDAYAF